MNLTISGHHVEVTPAMRSYVTDKLDRVIRHFDQLVDIRIQFTVENKNSEKEKRQCAMGSIHVKGKTLVAKCKHANVYPAVDKLADMLDELVVDYKKNLQNHHFSAPKRLM
ncbi:MAG: ribosome-associated translation inhibitor RaiA [Burkholderiaceae bacterium]|nr:ribosome-associated translation inhibitor RaiA [Burkholderiaceae bacterium]